MACGNAPHAISCIIGRLRPKNGIMKLRPVLDFKAFDMLKMLAVMSYDNKTFSLSGTTNTQMLVSSRYPFIVRHRMS